jgi:hypothetical protein
MVFIVELLRDRLIPLSLRHSVFADIFQSASFFALFSETEMRPCAELAALFGMLLRISENQQE